MFKKIKKWYFKIYHLFKLISVFILIFGACNKVYAEEQYYCSKSVNKIVTGNFVEGYVNPFGTEQLWNWWSVTYNGVIEVKENTRYSFKFMQGVGSNWKHIGFIFYNQNKEYINFNGIQTSDKNTFRSITTPAGTKYIILGLGDVSVQETNSVTSVLYEGNEYSSNKSITEPIINYEPCYEEEPPIQQDNVYSSFLTLYTDKINYLANGFTSNPYLLAMIGIIFSFVVLELFLKILHLKGGKYR